MANTIKQVTKDDGSKMNLGDIEIAAIKGVEQGTNVYQKAQVIIQTIRKLPRNFYEIIIFSMQYRQVSKF